MQKLGRNETMTPRERVMRTLNHQTPDRVPIDYASNPDIDKRLKEHFGLKPEQFEELFQAIGVDFRAVNAPYVGPRLHEEVPDRMVSPDYGIRTAWVEHGAGGYWDFVDFPLRDADEKTMREWPMPDPDDYDYEHVARMTKEFEDYACYLGNPGLPDLINSSGMLRSMDQVFLDLVTEDPAWQTFVERKVAIQAEILRRSLEAAEGRISFLWLGEDLGTQTSPLISLDVFRKQIRPRHQQVIDIARGFNKDMPIMIHCCGSSSWAFNDFIEMGITAIDTLQPEAVNMEPRYLKETYGDKLAFHGCISTAGPVSFGSPEDVRADCKKKLEILMPGGGYCFAPTHALQDNSPTENVVAMYESAHEFGHYND